jgi:surfeit locus 1 family protein
MSFRRPQIFPIVFIISATLLLGGMGTWQVMRLGWKNDMIAHIEAAQNKPILTQLPAQEDVLYRHVKLAGTFDHSKTLYFVGQPRAGQPGFQLETPFKLAVGGGVVMVSRGWSPRGKEIKPQGKQVIEGVIRPLREKRAFTPENRADINLYFYEDKAAMAAAVGVSQLAPYVIEQTGPIVPDTFPIASNGKISLRNDHLGYAITWFTLAFAGIIMFVLYHREKPTKS